jgi:hypothetical protein
VACREAATRCNPEHWDTLEVDPPNDPGLTIFEMLDLYLAFGPDCEDGASAIEDALLAEGVSAESSAIVAADIIELCEANDWGDATDEDILMDIVDCLDMEICGDAWEEADGFDFPCPCVTLEELVAVVKSALAPSRTLYFHGSGPVANPQTLFLNETAPVGTAARYRDSAGVNFNGGNPWKPVGTWNATPSSVEGNLVAVPRVTLWLGLKNSDDQGTRFDVRAEVYRNDVLVATGLQRCIQGITRNPNQAKEVSLFFLRIDALELNGTTDVLVVKVAARIGTETFGAKCPGHNNATGLRVYFDAANRQSLLETRYLP